MSDVFAAMVRDLAGDARGRRTSRSRRRYWGDATSLRWQPRELRFLREHYQAEGAQWCAQALGRTVKAVYTKANALGLRHVKEGGQ